MPRRSLLTIEQRTRLYAIAVDHAEMAKHYVLSPDDLALIPVWFNNVERVAAARVGQEPVRYVRNIYKYYVAYKLIEAADAAKKAAIAAATTDPAAGTSAPPQPAKHH